jgi:hypothetical protein
MAAKKKKAASKTDSADTSAAVDAFMSTLKHPHKTTVEALRKIICSADPSIEEGIKWNSPSFRTHEYFATTNLRAKEGIGVILHFGAKVRDVSSVKIKDPDGVLTWLAKDRAIVNFAGADDMRTRKPAFQAVVRQWIKFV